MSMALAMGSHDATDISNRDFILAAGLHILVVTLLLLLGAWHHNPEPEFKSVTVNLISDAQLQKTLRHHTPKKRVVRKHRAKPAPKPKPHKSKAMPALKKKPAAKPKHASKAKEEPFDPFQPLASTSDRKSSTAPAVSNGVPHELAPQLSKKELDHYTAMIVSAVQSNWKVPVFSGKVIDPKVEMILNPDGSVQRVEVVESSGNAALDDSLIRAIHAASPFIIPRQQYEQFRSMRFHFHPLR